MSFQRLFGKRKEPESAADALRRVQEADALRRVQEAESEPEGALEADPGAMLQKQFSDATVSVLADQVKAGTALAKSTSVAENARPDVSIATDLATLQRETDPGAAPGLIGCDFELTLGGDGGTVEAQGLTSVQAHRIVLMARSTYLRDLVLAASAEGTTDAPGMTVPDTLDLAELRAAVRMCYVGEAQQWAYR
jgi:hypothetical protein